MPLDFSRVRYIPQAALLKQIAADLYASEDVRAIWLGGSLARGQGDAFSDIDLRLFLTRESFVGTELLAAAETIRRDAVVHLPISFENGVLHHLMLKSGTILDLFVQSVDSEPSPEARLILGVKDETLAAKLANGLDPSPPTFQEVDPRTIERLLATFWISEQKHLKVIHRGLGLVAWQGEHFIRQEILKLFFIYATGRDCDTSTGGARDGSNPLASIHVMSPVARAIQKSFGDEALALLGSPRRTVGELSAEAMSLQNTVSRIGRILCDRHGATYPEQAESTVRRSWQSFELPNLKAGIIDVNVLPARGIRESR